MDSTGSTGDFERGDEVPEADAQEQQQDALTAGAADDPEAPVAQRLSGRDLDSALASANEADLAEQEREVPFDDDFER